MVIKELYEKRNYALMFPDKTLILDEYSDDEKLYIGYALLELGDPHAALTVLHAITDQTVIKSSNGKINRYCGLCYYMLGDLEQANLELKSGCNREAACNDWEQLLFPVMQTERTERNFNIHYVGSFSTAEQNYFAQKCSDAYYDLIARIGCNFNSIIQIYVYWNHIDSINNPLSYANTALKTIHINYLGNIKHELVHVIANNIYPHTHKNRFWDEGLATYFSYDVDNWEAYVNANSQKIVILDVKKLWNNFRAYGDSVCTEYLYIFSGAFVGFMIKIYGIEQIRKFLFNQSYEFAVQHFPSLENVISKFQDTLASQFLFTNYLEKE